MAKRLFVMLLAVILVLAAGCTDPVDGGMGRPPQENTPEATASPSPTPSLSPTPEPTPKPTEDVSDIIEAARNIAETGGVELTPDELRELAFGAVLTARNPINYNSLKGTGEESQVGLGISIKVSYGIYDRETAIESLNWLRDEGHRGTYNDMLDYMNNLDFSEITEYDLEMLLPVMTACLVLYEALIYDYGYTEKELESLDSVTAWDMDRLVTVARICYLSGYIAEAEAWEYIGFAAETAVREYHSWRGYFAGVLLGRALWSRDQEFTEQNREVADALLKSEDSIYNQVPFAPPAGERRASRVYGTYEEMLAEIYCGMTFDISGLDALAAFGDGASDNIDITMDEEELYISITSFSQSIYLSVKEADNGEVDQAYLALSPFDKRTLEAAIADIMVEFERLAEILGISVGAMAKAFDPDLMDVYETVVDTETLKNAVVKKGSMTLETRGVTYEAQYTAVNEKLFSVTAIVSKP